MTDAPRHPEMTVLLVEDNDVIGELTLARLGRLVGRARWARDGVEGLEEFHALRPDLVLVDELMPRMRGSEMVAEIRKIDSRVSIIGITASAMGREQGDLLAAGADLALSKPLSGRMLADLVAEVAAAK